MKHTIVYKRAGVYGAFPILQHLPDGRLTVGLSLSPFVDRYAVGPWTVLVSSDEGGTWAETDDPTLPATWPGACPREQSDRFAAVMPDGHRPGQLLVNRPTLFVQRSEDGGKTWSRREWDVPGFRGTSFSRPAQLEDGTILEPVYGSDLDGKSQCLVWRGSNGGRTWRLHPIGPSGNETAFLEVSPGRVLALSRNGDGGGDLIERWSDDGGVTWTQALDTSVYTPGSPPHLIKLRDGQVLLTHGYRKEPMGIRAVFSHDGGETWDIENTVVPRDDGGFPSELRTGQTRSPGDNGYAHSTQLSDGSILSVYYITLADRTTHSAATRWTP